MILSSLLFSLSTLHLTISMLTRRNPERERNQLTIFHNGHVHASQKLRRWFIPVPREKFLTVHLHDFPHVVFAIVHNVHKHFKQSRHLLLQRSGPDGNERLGRSRRRFKNNYVRVKCDVSCYLSHLSLSPPPFVHRIPPPLAMYLTGEWMKLLLRFQTDISHHCRYRWRWWSERLWILTRMKWESVWRIWLRICQWVHARKVHYVRQCCGGFVSFSLLLSISHSLAHSPTHTHT